MHEPANHSPRPAETFAPCEYLIDELNSREWSTFDLATRIGWTVERTHKLLAGDEPISSDTAIRLSRVFGTSAELWLNLQKTYQAH